MTTTTATVPSVPEVTYWTGCSGATYADAHYACCSTTFTANTLERTAGMHAEYHATVAALNAAPDRYSNYYEDEGFFDHDD